MNEPQGWISLHRKLLEHPLFQDPPAFMLWVQLLLRANHKDNKVMIGNQFVDVNRGQLITGRKALAKYTGLSESKIERLLKLFESEQQIKQQTFTKFRLISITNYNQYQDGEQQLNNKRTTTEQQPNTNNNDNNENKKNTVPFEKISNSYNELFAGPSGCPRIEKVSEKRKRAIRKLWNFCTEDPDPKKLTNNPEYWDRYFKHISTLTFFQADTERTNGHENWKPNFDFVMKEDTLIGVKEKRYT